MNRIINNLVEGSLAAVGGLSTLVVLAFALVYVLGELEGRRSGTRDPALGVKVATAMLATVAFQVALIGLTALLTGLIADMGRYTTKPAGGMLLGALVAGALPLTIYLTKLRTSGGYAVGRKAIGLNAVMCGLVFTFVTVSLVTLAVSGADVDSLVAGWLVYGAATFTGLGTLIPRRDVADVRF